MFTKKELEFLLEAFINWLDDEDWDDRGEAINPTFQAIIGKLKEQITLA